MGWIRPFDGRADINWIDSFLFSTKRKKVFNVRKIWNAKLKTYSNIKMKKFIMN